MFEETNLQLLNCGQTTETKNKSICKGPPYRGIGVLLDCRKGHKKSIRPYEKPRFWVSPLEGILLSDFCTIAVCLKHCSEEVKGRILYTRSRRALSAQLPICLRNSMFALCFNPSIMLGPSQHLSSPIDYMYCGR